MLPISLEIGIADEYPKVASAQLVCPFSDEDNVSSLHKESAFDSAFDFCIAVCPANEMAGLHQLQIGLYWLQNDPGTLHIWQAAAVPCFSLRNTSHHIIVCGIIFILWVHNGIKEVVRMLEQESFWENDSFVVVTDKTKPAMKLTIDELVRRGKKVYVVDLSDNPDQGTKRSILDLPSDIDCAIVGLKKERTENAIVELKHTGIRKCWIHWRTQTVQAEQKCAQLQMQCIFGKCPMMYLSRSLNIHTMHANLAKLLGKY